MSEKYAAEMTVGQILNLIPHSITNLENEIESFREEKIQEYMAVERKKKFLWFTRYTYHLSREEAEDLFDFKVAQEPDLYCLWGSVEYVKVALCRDAITKMQRLKSDLEHAPREQIIHLSNTDHSVLYYRQ